MQNKRFVPWNLCVGAMVPNSIMRYSGLTSGAKLCWARLAQFSGRDGKCFPTQTKLATEIGKSVAQAKRYVAELVDKGFLEKEAATGADRLKHKPNTYYFLWHPIFEEIKDKDEKYQALNKDTDEPPCGGIIDERSGGVADELHKRISIKEKEIPCQASSACQQADHGNLVNFKPSGKNGKFNETARDVFDYWCSVMGKNGNVRLSADRKAKIVARLKEGYTVDDIKLAIDGCRLSPHNMGKNDRHTKYNDIELICRKGSILERFRSHAREERNKTRYIF